MDVSMLDTAVSLMSPMAGLPLNYDVDPQISGNGAPGTGGPSSVFPTADGTVTVAAVTPTQFTAMAHEIGRGDMAEDERFATSEARIAHAAEYRRLMLEAFANDTAENWEIRLNSAGVPASKNKQVRELRDDAQLTHREMFLPLPSPPGITGDFHAVNLGFKLGYDGPSVADPPPTVGQHNDDILGELGFSDDAIAGFQTSGAI